MSVINLFEENPGTPEGSLINLASYGASPATDCSIKAAGRTFISALAESGFTMRKPSTLADKDFLPIPGLYAVISASGGGKSTFCRKLSTCLDKARYTDSEANFSYCLISMGEPEDPYNSFFYGLSKITTHINDRCNHAHEAENDVPSAAWIRRGEIVIVDSLTDLAFVEIPRATRSMDQEDILNGEIFGLGSPDAYKMNPYTGQQTQIGSLDIRPTVLDAILQNVAKYLQPSSAAMPGGLTGAYFQILKKLSTACTQAGIYLVAVLNPLVHDQNSAFRDAVGGVCAGTLSIDTKASSSSLCRCVEITHEDGHDDVDYNSRARLPLEMGSLASSAESLVDLHAQLLSGGIL